MHSKYNFFLTLLIILLTGYNVAIAQTDTLRTKTISIVPQYLINKGLRIDFEKQLSSRQWLQVAPQFYMDLKGRENSDYSSSDDDTKDYEKMYGFGLDLNHKIFLKNNLARPFGGYVSYGASYQHFSITLKGYRWDKVEVDGLPQLKPTFAEATQTIEKIGAQLCIGAQYEIVDFLFWDIYIGLGFRYSIYNSPLNIRRLEENLWDYGYSGTTLIGGFRLGVAL